jgi:hypothetical protein
VSEANPNKAGEMINRDARELGKGCECVHGSRRVKTLGFAYPKLAGFPELSDGFRGALDAAAGFFHQRAGKLDEFGLHLVFSGEVGDFPRGFVRAERETNESGAGSADASEGAGAPFARDFKEFPVFFDAAQLLVLISNEIQLSEPLKTP